MSNLCMIVRRYDGKNTRCPNCIFFSVGEIEITRIEESPLDGGSEEIVSGNIKEMRVNKLDMVDR